MPGENSAENMLTEKEFHIQKQELLETKQKLKSMIEELEKKDQELISTKALLKESEERLLHTRSRFEIAAAESKIGIWDRNLINDHSEWDAVTYALFGLKDQSIDIDKDIWRNFIHPDDLADVDNAFQIAIEKSDKFDLEYRVIWEDSSIHYLHTYAIVHRDDSHKPIRLIGTIMDITDRKLAEIALRESEEKYKRDNLLLEESQAIAKLGGWELDVVTGQLYWTAETYRIHDTSPEEFNPTVDAGVSYFLPESKKIISEALELAMTKGEGYDLNLETYTTKGRKIDVRTTCAVTMESGKPIKLTGIFQDITEQKKIQNEIEISNKRLSLATQAAKMGIWEYVINDQNLIWDEKMYELYGVSADTFPSAYVAWSNGLHPEDRHRSEQELENAIAGKKEFDKEFRVVWPDKSIHHIKGFANVVFDTKGKAIKLIGVNYDITEQKKAQMEIERSNASLNIATEAAKIGIWEFTMEDGILVWDDQMFNLFDVPKSRFSGTYEAWRATVHPEDLTTSEQELENAIATGNSFNAEFRIIWQDKSIHHIKAIADFIRDENGKPIKVIGVNYDVTERYQRENELIKAKEKAEENDRLKSAFLANIRHEIRNPMNAIIGFSKQMMAKNTTESKRAEYSSIVINSSNQLLNIIDDITAISLLETKQEHINKSEVNINNLLSELEMQFAPQAKTRNLKLNLTKSLPDKESIITTDKSKLTRIITNLLTNALKFTHEGAIKFGYEIKGKDLLFFVQDSGIGVSTKQLKRIFESFQQADGSISRKYGGTGLGLSISKGLTEILGGQIWVESKVNKGSTFYVSLPFDQVKSYFDKPGSERNTGLNNIILIAEDELINFLYLKILFENNFNCEILHVANGEKAVELFKNNPGIRLALMDISMPVMDGFDAARLIKEINADVHIIAQTGYDIEQNEKYSPDIFDDYITKPIIDNVLISKVAEFIPKVSNEKEQS